MKYTYKTLTGLLSVMLIIVVSIAACSNSTGATDEDEIPVEPIIVSFPDPLLEAQVRLSLSIDSETDITDSLMLELEVLDIDASNDFSGELSGISNLTGLEYALNLNYLRLSYTDVTDLSPISDLENIEYLRFNNTAITDISPISNFTNLTYFNANTVTGLTDISPLSGNTGLQTAILREVPFGNAGMETIRNFTSLHRINMRNTGVTDITVLGEIMAAGALQNSTPGAEENDGGTIDLRGLEITDYSPIAPYISNIANVDGVPAVEIVTIPDSDLESYIRAQLGIDVQNDVTNLYMTGLDTVNVSGILPIADLTGLEYAVNVKYLRFGGTNVTDLSPIANLTNVEYLRFNDTAVTDISPIANYTTLTYFNANTVTGLNDISPLAGNDNLKEAILRSVPFGNAGMATLRNITSLYRLNMRNTGVTDITVLGQMMQDGALLDSTEGAAEAGGATLDVRQLDVADWSPIEPFVSQISNLDGYPG
jgi:cyclic lactone autoinducer peptide